jgi:alpha-ketoglutarate-dependent taurine dioxygenase
VIAGSAAFPLVVDAPPRHGGDDLAWLRERRGELLAELRRHGAIRFSAAEVDSPERLAAFSGALLGERSFGYAGGDSPRTRLSASVYTSTEFPAEYAISLHNELSYAARYPEFVLFCCAVPADDGGETPLADSRRLLAALDPALVAEFERRGVTYVRNLHGGDGVGRSWQDTFETGERDEVEALCARSGAEARWKPGGGLQVRQTRPALATHPVTGERVWFNQADQFHPSTYPARLHGALIALYGDDPETLPSYATFGDGTRIPAEMLGAVRAAGADLAVARPWRRGEVLWLDNLLCAHGRNPFRGDRRILVSLA